MIGGVGDGVVWCGGWVFWWCMVWWGVFSRGVVWSVCDVWCVLYCVWYLVGVVGVWCVCVEGVCGVVWCSVVCRRGLVSC